MSNNLQKLAKDLRAFAKRCKDIKYTRALLFVFLLTGLLSMAAPADNVETARKDLNTSITDMKKLFKEAKQENNKLMKGSNLELIQLMEQGDHVVKTPWSSWQYGMNYFYSDWRGTYKGRGDKSKENLNLARKTDPLERFKFSSQMSATYGTTSLDLVYEPPREVEVSAGIRPKEVNKQAPTFVPSEPSGSLPPFEPKIIQPPKAPEVTPPQINEPEPLVFGNFGSSISSEYYLWNPTGQTMMKQVTLTAGKIKGKTGVGAYTKGVAGVAGYGTTTGATLQQGTLTGSTPTDGMNNSTQEILYGIRDSAFMDWSDSVEISWFGDFGKPLIYMETGSNNGTNNTSLDHLYAAGTGPVSKDLYDEVKGYKTQSGLKELEGGSEGINLHNNRGKIYLGDSNTWYNATTVLNSRRLSVLNNQGSITGLNINNGASGVNGSEKQVVFFNSPDYDNDTPQRWIFANGKTGKINMYGKQSLVMYYTSDDGTRQSQNETAFINEGEINLYGIESSGVMISGTETLKTESGFYLNNPINIYSDSSRGVYIAGNISNVAPTQAIVRVHIGKGKNDTTGVDWTDIETGTVTKIDSNGNDTVAGSTVNMVDNSIGVMYTNANTGAKIQAPDITMEKFARKSIGILTTDGKLTVSNGNININGGEGNVALYAKGGEIVYNGNVTIGTSSLSTTGGNNLGKGNIGIFAENGHKVTLNGVLKTHNTDGSTRDGIGIYANNSDVSVTQAVDMKYEAGTTGESVGIYSKGPGTGAAGKTVTILGDGSKINIDGGTTNKGTALYSGAGGKIVADSTATNGGLQVTVTNGASAIASDGTNSNVSAKFSNIDYSGEGYALYTSSNGKIDVTGSKISLRGNATGFERDVTVATSPITFTDGTNAATITAYSNNVTIMNLRNVPTLNLSTLNTNLQTYTGGVSHSAGTDPVTGEVYNKYKTAAVDGLSAYNIDTDLDKSIATDDANASTNDYVFTRRVAVQRGIVNLKAGKNVKAILSTADLSNIGEASVVGLSMNSSSYATSNAEAGINLEANTTVTADRTTAGNGAVGLYINYGKINTDASSTINVEKETSNSANDSAVGIYSVNGSEVTNEGKVNVGGQSSIGILGVAYRIDSATNNPIINEFGTAAAGQGRATILNKGQVALDGANATGIYVKNNNSTATRTTATGTNDTTGVITMSGVSSTGMSGDKATLENKGTININGQKSVGMFAKNSSELKNSGTINLVDGLSGDDPNIGMYTSDDNTKIINDKDIIGGNNTYGIYGKKVDLNATGKIKVGDNSVGIYSNGQHATGLLGSTIHLASGSKIEVGNNQSVGVFTTGTNQIISGDADMQIGDGSYGYVIKGTGTQLDTNVASGVTLGNDAVYVYSSDTTGNIRNNTELTATGSKNYGIYAAGTVTNLANINFGTGAGNVGMYSIGGGTATNGSATVHPTITVSGSDTINKLYGIGMAAGYVNNAGTLVSTGNVVNHGTIKVEKDNGIGMFATGSGSTATNYGTIELSGKKTTGMYLDNNAVGYNYGTITTVPNPANDGITGVVASNGAIIKNYGTINIVDGSNLTGVFINKGTQAANYDDQIPGGGTGVLNGPIEVKKQSATGKTVAGINIVAPGNGTATIYRDGVQVIPVAVDTNRATPKPATVNVGTTPISLTAVDLATPSLGQASSIGMYVDTSGVNYTNPIQGLNKLTGLQKVDLFFGTEASKYTNEKDIEVGKNILKPYNDVISTLSSGTSIKFSFASGSLTWIATATQNTDDTLKSLYLSKIPYTSFSSESNTNKFLDGLEQRYGVEGIGTREKALFDKLNGIGKGEAVLFAQAVDQMKGHQYSNVQQRIQATGNVLNKEFDYLRNSWSNSTKDSNKIKVFGNRGEYNTDTAGVIDYVSNAYGVAYVHENETVKLGNSSGWYAGAVTNRFKFKDIGKSTENQTMLKLGIFKTMSPVTDHNGSLQWTISGEGYVARNAMHRKYLVVDDIFNAKSDYTTYGVAVKNELGYNIRTSERTSIRPYGSLKLEYGRFGNIKEKSGEMRLEVKENDYYSVKPEVGIEFKYKQPMAVKTTFTAALGLGYENELGKVGDVNNKARVGYTNADWYNLRGEKEDRKGNFKADLNIGVDNTRFGVTFNAGYDTKGHNVRGGLGFRVIY